MLININPENFIKGDPYTFTTTVSQDTYDLATDHYKIYGVDLDYNPPSPNSRLTIQRESFRERNRRRNGYVYTGPYDYGPYFRWYQPTNDRIRFSPVPQQSHTILVWYVPEFTELTSDSDTSEAAIEKYWLRYVELHAAIQAKTKSKQDVRTLFAQKKEMEKRISDAVMNQYLNQPHYATNVLDDYDYGYGAY